MFYNGVRESSVIVTEKYVSESLFCRFYLRKMLSLASNNAVRGINID